jgi:nitrogen fixation protein FixH
MTTPSRPFTGWHMLAVMIAFFGVIVAVNVTMATLALTSWTGLVVQNSYVASQEFNDRARAGRAQAALGGTAELAYSNGVLRYALVGETALRWMSRTFRCCSAARPTKPTTRARAGAQRRRQLRRRRALGDGQWIVRVSAEAGLAEPYLDIRRIFVRNGAAQ